MSTFVRCDSCGGVVPGAVCPNCLTAVSRAGGVGGFLKRLILGVGGASVASMTLMACYGMPPCDPEGVSADGGSDPYECYEPTEDAGEELDGGADAGP